MTATPPPPASALAAAAAGWLLGRDPRVRRQTGAVLFCSGSYVFYGLILAVQVANGLVERTPGLWLGAAMLAANALFYAVVRSGIASRGPDPGLTGTQMLVGIAFMYAAYAMQGPAAPGVVIIMASHVVYAMFWMKPRGVWRLVAGSLAGLAATMLLCHLQWPERYPAAVQLSGLLYAALVVPMIALLASRVAGMTQRLQVQRVQLEQALAEVRALAERDELTRVHNRHHMTGLLGEQRRAHLQGGQPLALALVDIDLFKRVNDEHGHAVGDEVLRRFAALAKSELRSGDLVARWGGEEFLLALPHTPRAAAQEVVDRLQRTLADPMQQHMPAGLRVSFSAGIVELQPEEALDSAIERADQAMYAAKRAGRARCVPA